MAVVIKTVGEKRYAYHAYRSGTTVVQRYLGPMSDPRVSVRVERLRAARGVPRALHPLFWDTDPERVDVRRHARYIIERVLETGGLDAFRWIQMAYPTRTIAEVCASSRRISERSRTFWSIWMGVADGPS